MGSRLSLLFRRRKPAAVVPALVDDGTLTEVGGAESVEAGDGAAVAAIAAAGVDLSGPVLVRHALLVNDPAAAEALADAVRADGYDVRIETFDGGWTWVVRATETVLLTPLHAARARGRLTSLATRHGAEYEGWEAAAP